MKYIYGPVKSRRLGLSLGISLTPHKICSFDCVYCQLGRTAKTTVERKEYIPRVEILNELTQWLERHKEDTGQLQYITFSGFGEPTLNSGIAGLISEIKKFTVVPIAVITNASLLHDPLVRRWLLGADLIVPSLDAANPDVFNRINRPHAGISVEKIIQGLIDLRREFTGKIWLEVMLVKGLNDGLKHTEELKKVIAKIKPDKIQLNSPARKPAESGVSSVERGRLEAIRAMLGDTCEIV